MHRRAVVVRVLLACMVLAAPSVGEELKQIREGIHQPESPPEEKREEECEDDDSFGEELAGELFAETAGGILGGVVTAGFASMISEPGHERFAGHAVEHGTSKFKETEWFYQSNYFISSARAQIEYGTDYRDMQSVGTRLQIDFPRFRSTIDASWNNYYEDTAIGTDHLGLGDVNWVFRITQEETMVSRMGVGVNWLAGDESAAGFNFTTGMDVLLPYPLVWSTDLDMGTLGDASLFRIRTTLGAQWRDGELYTGFEYVDIEDAQIPQMLFGFRYWW